VEEKCIEGDEREKNGGKGWLILVAPKRCRFK